MSDMSFPRGRTVYSFEGATIIYCRTRKITEEVAAVLKSKKMVAYSALRKENEEKKGYMSGVGFEPTPTIVDCDLNAAP